MRAYFRLFIPSSRPNFQLVYIPNYSALKYTKSNANSDGNMQQLVHDFGARGAQIEEILTMDDAEFAGGLLPLKAKLFNRH